MKMDRVHSGASWEKEVAYCRALRAGSQIYVSGTTSLDEQGQVCHVGDPYAQAFRCLTLISDAVQKLSEGRGQIVRTRIFVTDIHQWEAFGRAHREFFKEAPPATTMVEVQRLIHPDLLVEIEADAIYDQE